MSFAQWYEEEKKKKKKKEKETSGFESWYNENTTNRREDLGPVNYNGSSQQGSSDQSSWLSSNQIWGNYLNEPDYIKYSTIGANVKNPTFDEAEGWANLFGWHVGGKDVGNIVTYSRDNANYIGLAEMNSNKPVGNSKYRHMTDDEVGVYNYLLGKYGKEKAEEFLNSIEEELNIRDGLTHANAIKNTDSGAAKAFGYTAASFGGGVDQFATGVKQEFSSEKLPTTSMSVLNQELGKDLEGIESILYDTGTTLGNMAPSIVASYMTGGTVGPILGSTLMGTSAAGNAYGRAIEDGYDEMEARAYSTLVGVSEAALQYLIGGVTKLGGKGTSSLLANKINMIDNALLRLGAKYGVSTISEVTEEELQNYLEPAFRTIIFGEEYDAPTVDELIETALVSALSTGAINATTNIASGDPSEFTKNERKVVKTLYEETIAEKESGGKKLTNKEKNQIYDTIVDNMAHGQLDINDIERVLGGETYEAYKSLVESEDAVLKEFEDLGKKQNPTLAEQSRYAELKAKADEINSKSERIKLKTQLSDDVFGIVQKDKTGRLAESYREVARKGQAFEADLTRYKGKQREAVERAVKSGVLNNTYRSHVLVDTLSKIEADKGIVFDYTDNAKIKEAGFGVEGVIVNGYVSDGAVTLNVQSAKAWQSVVGHEITHVLEGTDAYSDLQKALYEYAESKGELASRKASLTELYKNVDADIDSELTADLVGDYLFTDKNFVTHLTTNRNLFQRVYDEIKYLCKVATGKGLTEIEKVRREFDKAWTQLDIKMEESDVKHSFSSIAHSFYGDESMSAVAFEEGDYKGTEGYKDYVDKCLENMRQTRESFDEAAARQEIDEQLNGIMRVALASKRAGYDIPDNAQKRNSRDSKGRLLFSSLEPNSDYFTSDDISTICDKRMNFTEIYDEIVSREESMGVPVGKRFFSNINNYFYLHKILADKGLTQPCRECYVESMRKNLAPMAEAFISLVTETDVNNKANKQLYEQSGKNKGKLKTGNSNLRNRVLEILAENPEYGMSAEDLTVEMLTTEEGLAQLRIQAPLIYEAYNSFYGQSKPKMPKAATPFRFGELTALLTDHKGKINQKLVDRINATGGFRLQSYSDFQVQNYTDVLQVLFEAGTLGLSGHAYTKVPAFLEATDGTNLKRNISVFMYKDGDQWKIDRNDSFPGSLEELYEIVKADKSGNTGIVAVSQNKEMSAWIMANDFIGYGIPFHKSGLRMKTVRDTDVRTEDGRVVKGYSKTIDHTKQQSEVWARASTDHKALTKVKKGINIYEFWDFNNAEGLSKNELIEKNVREYIRRCEIAGYLPKFRDYVLNNEGVVKDVLRYSKEMGFVEQTATVEDISFRYEGKYGTYVIPYGYHKFLGDFGMFKPDGTASPHDVLSLKNYDFDKAEEFFMDSESLRRNKILQQFANDGERQKYRDSGLSAEELSEVIRQKRNEAVDEIVPYSSQGVDYSLSAEGEQIAPVGNFSTPLESMYYNGKQDVAPDVFDTEAVAEENLSESAESVVVSEDDIAPVQENTPEDEEITPEVEEEIGDIPEGEQEGTERLTRSGLHESIIDNIVLEFHRRGYDFHDVLKKAKNLSTFATVDNTPQRVIEKALGYKEGQILNDLTVNKVAQHETEGIRWLDFFTNRKSGLLSQLSKQYGIKPGSKESAAAQMYAEGFYVDSNNKIVAYGDAELAIDFPDIRVQNNIKGLAGDPRIRQIYDETLSAINESRRRNAYPEIPRLDNYYLHFRAMEDTFSRLGLPFNPNDIRAKDLPTDLNGVTADLRPGQPFFASAMHRKGKRTSFDLLGGLERYLTSAKNQIYHIDDIQTLRALRNYIADTYGQAQGLEDLDSLTEEEAQERIEQVFGSHLSTFAKFLNEEANALAGKTPLIDRGLEGIIGRRGITFIDTVNKQVGSNMVGFNLSSSLTNFIPVVQTFAKSNKFDFIKAFSQTVSNKFASIYGKGDSFAEDSPVMIRRKGADRFYRTPFQKAGDAGYFLMGVSDSISTELIARTKYNEFTRKGMDSQKAHFEADKWVSRLMGDRSLGQQPLLYNSKMLGVLTKFQLEVRNQLDSQFYDTVQEAKVSYEDIENRLERNAKTAAKITSAFTQLAIAQFLFGKAFESVTGYNPAFDIISVLGTMFGFDDEEESEDTVLDNIEQGFFELMEDLPYTSTFTGGRVPISSALPIKQLFTGKDDYGNEKSRLETLKEAAPYYVLPTGYGQIKKTVQGLKMFNTDEDHPVAGSYTDSGNLRFPVEDTLGNKIQAGLFGQYASENAREYFDNGYAPLKEKQIQEYIDLELPIADYWKYREGLKGLETNEEKADYINSLDIADWQKNLLMNNILDRKEDVDMSDYNDYSNWEEFDYAQKNPEKYVFSKAVGGYDAYKSYSDKLNDIKSDKDENGKSVSGSRKAKVLDYINNLDADYGTKLILWKSEYPSEDTYNVDIINYLNGREDISYDEMVTILTMLGFKVNGDTVYWD